MSEYHNRSYENQAKVYRAETCGCYHCCETFPADTVLNYIKDKHGYTANCPLCGIDSVIAFDVEIDGNMEQFKKYLQECRKKSFT